MISDQDLEKAKLRQETIDQEQNISITADGKVRFQTAIGTWAIAGVLSIGRLSEYLPDLSDGCPVDVGETEYGRLTKVDNLIWGLAKPFKELNIEFGDYIELEFYDKKDLKARVNVLERRADHLERLIKPSQEVQSLRVIK